MRRAARLAVVVLALTGAATAALAQTPSPPPTPPPQPETAAQPPAPPTPPPLPAAPPAPAPSAAAAPTPGVSAPLTDESGEAPILPPKPGEPPANPLTQQGAADRTVPDLAAQQAQVLRQAIAQQPVEPAANVKPPIDVGTMLLRTVVLHPLPQPFLDVAPKYAKFGFFVLPDGTIGIVNPGPYQIAALYPP